jgi:hypothetical protein
LGLKKFWRDFGDGVLPNPVVEGEGRMRDIIGRIFGADLGGNRVVFFWQEHCRLPGKMLTDRSRIPFVVKIAYTAFVALHVTLNWQAYGPLNFLWFCDVAVLTLLVGLWLESSLLCSIAGVAILLPMGLWIFDLGARVVLGHYVFGFAGYMFDRRVPKDIRILSSFHLWMPLILVSTLRRLGYDRRAIWIQSVLGAVLILVCWFVSAAPPAHGLREAVNINWVYGPSDEAAQTFLPAGVYVGVMIVFYPLLIYLPTHLTLSALFAGRARGGALPFGLQLSERVAMVRL